MPAGITNTDTMFSVRERPWHGLGVVLDKAPKTIEEALEKSGLGWEVAGLPLTAGPDIEVTDFKANVRMDTQDVLGVVGAGYTVVQNREAFHFLNELLGGEVVYETAGSLWGGRRVWVLAKLPETQEIGGDATDTYLYVANSHDGSLAVTAAATPVRIVCNNTLRLALGRSEKAPQSMFKFHHVGELQSKMDEARAALSTVIGYADWFKGWGDELAAAKFTEKQFGNVLKRIIPVDDSLAARAITNRTVQRDTVMSLFKGEGPAGDTRGNAPDTKWCAVNAVVEYADWGRGRRENSEKTQMERSFEDLQFKKDGVKLVLAAR